jgi:hypothetical protein
MNRSEVTWLYDLHGEGEEQVIGGNEGFWRRFEAGLKHEKEGHPRLKTGLGRRETGFREAI